ncbi:MAG TPA: hypothetical protein VG603_08200 [Chitinophagales bacterium]|nr:hypothetical protein [Chitinophagales bacterium]
METQTEKSKSIIKYYWQFFQGLALCLLVLMAFKTNAQDIWEERRGCIKFQGDLAPGYLLKQKQVSAYVDGDLGVFVEDRVELTGALWASFDLTHPDETGIKANHALFTGVNYHFLKPSHWDPFIGFTPGVGLVRGEYKDANGQLVKAPFAAAPLVSASVGCAYYVGWLFNFFVKVQYVYGQTFSDLPVPDRLDELKFLAGLGFNFRAWRPKLHDKWKTKTPAATSSL